MLSLILIIKNHSLYLVFPEPTSQVQLIKKYPPCDSVSLYFTGSTDQEVPSM